jgi:hypothetical protein
MSAIALSMTRASTLPWCRGGTWRRRSGEPPRRPGCRSAAGQLGGTLPVPLYVLYEKQMGFGPLGVTVVFAAPGGVLAVALVVVLRTFGAARAQAASPARRQLVLPGGGGRPSLRANPAAQVKSLIR